MCQNDTIIELKQKFNYIKISLAIPCINHDKLWDYEDKQSLKWIIERSDEIIYISDCEYKIGCMQKRNKYMVDRSSLLIAAYNGKKGGTKTTIEYAKANFLEVQIIKMNHDE